MIGKTISHYKILEKLGEGGMGVVYKAQDTRLDRTVALKFLSPQTVGSEEDRARFVHEAKSAAALSHPNICTVHEIDEAEGQSFIAIEYIEGQSLKDRIASGPLKLDEAIDITIQVAEGLKEAHDKGIVHRDIKPANIMITPGGRVKIMDFGLAKSRSQTALTKADTTLGTFAYMSPEQTRGEDVDQRTDIWSVGTVLYEMITGQRPFKGDYEQAIVYSILNEEPEPVTGLRAGVPRELERIVSKALQKEAGRRYQSAQDLLVDVENLRRAGEVIGFPERPPRKSHRRLLVSLTAAAIVVVAALLGVRVQIGRQSPAVAEENSLAIMYFENIVDPADPQRLGEIVTNLLITDLSESQYMQVVSSQRMYDILKALGKEGAKVIDRDVASRVAAEARAEWMLLGSILQVEPQVVITSQLIKVQTGKVVSSQRVDGEPNGDVFSLVDRLAVEIREDLSLPIAAQEELDRAVADVTTHSPEAYRYYLEGREHFRKLYWTEAAASFNRALDFDSTFAMAYARLAAIEWWSGGTQYGEFLAQAVRYSDHASWKEKRNIHGQAAFVSGDIDRAIEEMEEVLDRYPDDKDAYLQLGLYFSQLRQYERAIQAYTKATEIDPLYKMAYNLLAYAHNSAGDYEKSIEAINRYIAIAPDEANPYDTRGDLYAYNGDLDRAIESYRKAFEIRPDFSPGKLGRMYLFKGDYEEAARYFQKLLESNDKHERALGREYLALIPLYGGQFDEALRVLDDGIGADRIEQTDAMQSNKHVLKALAYEEKGDLRQALEEIRISTKILSRVSTIDAFSWSEEYARLLAKAGDFTKAEEIAETLRHSIEESDKSRMYLYRYALGCIEFARGNFDEAIARLEEAVEDQPDLQIRYILARSYLEAGRLGEAVAMFEKALSRYDRAAAFYAPWTVKAHYFLGAAYERSGWTAEAIEQYEEFLEIWKDADPGIPEVEDARRRLDGLVNPGQRSK